MVAPFNADKYFGNNHESFLKQRERRNLWYANSLGRWTAKPISNHWYSGQGVCLPRCRYELCQSSRWHLTQMWVNAVDTAENSATKHTNEMVQGWFSVVTMVQGLSQQMFGNLFWNLLWPDLSRIETRIVLKLDVLAVFVQSISGSASLFIPHRNCWELLCLKAFHKISAFHGKVYQKMGLCLRCEATGTGPLILGPIRVETRPEVPPEERDVVFSMWKHQFKLEKIGKIRQIFITYDFFLMRFPNVLEGRFSQILGNLLIYFGNPNFSGFRIATIWQIGFRCQGSD